MAADTYRVAPVLMEGGEVGQQSLMKTQFTDKVSDGLGVRLVGKTHTEVSGKPRQSNDNQGSIKQLLISLCIVLVPPDIRNSVMSARG